MKLIRTGYKIPISTGLFDLLEELIQKHNADHYRAITMVFKSSDYSREHGGYRPVEIRIEDGKLAYMTDFTWVGEDYCKGIDFDFQMNVFYQVFDMDRPITEAKSFFKLYVSNFLEYYSMNVFDEITVEEG